MRVAQGFPPTNEFEMFRLVTTACLFAPAFASEGLHANEPFGGFAAFEEYDAECTDEE